MMGNMTDNLTVDGASLAQIGRELAIQGASMPQQTKLSVGNCGSPAVISAMNGFSMWASVTEMVTYHSILQTSTDLHDVAVTFGDWDDRAASQSGGPI
jgi:hypothetical protein